MESFCLFINEHPFLFLFLATVVIVLLGVLSFWAERVIRR